MALTLTHICTTYNYAHLLPEHLEGVRIQHHRPRRVVVSDDASPGDTPEAVHKACEGFADVEVIVRTENLGTSRHVNLLCNDIDTDAYIAMSADDTLVDPEFYADALKLLEQDPTLVAVWGLHQNMDEQGRLLAPRRIEVSEKQTRVSAQEMRTALAYDMIVSSVCVVVRAERASGIDAYPVINPYCSDWLHFYLLTLSGDFVRFNRVVCNYRIQESGLYLSQERKGLSRQRRDEGYAALLAWPDLSEEDRRHLRRGRARSWIRLSRLVQLPAAMVRHAVEPKAWTALVETLVGRIAPRLARPRRGHADG